MGIELGTIAAISAIAGGAATVYKAIKGSDSTAPQSPPPPPPTPVTFQDPLIAQGGDAARRRAIAAGGIMSNIATSPMGDISAPSTTGKTLLGQ